MKYCQKTALKIYNYIFYIKLIITKNLQKVPDFITMDNLQGKIISTASGIISAEKFSKGEDSGHSCRDYNCKTVDTVLKKFIIKILIRRRFIPRIIE